MKKLIKKLTILSITTVFFLLTSISVLAWDDCPKGKVNDPYPGECARYVDTDNNGICDHSEPAPEDRVENIEETNENPQNTNSNISKDADKEDNLTVKIVLASSIVMVNLVGILVYVNYRKAKL